jgi:hypothetical protein
MKGGRLVFAVLVALSFMGTSYAGESPSEGSKGNPAAISCPVPLGPVSTSEVNNMPATSTLSLTP